MPANGTFQTTIMIPLQGFNFIFLTITEQRIDKERKALAERLPEPEQLVHRSTYVVRSQYAFRLACGLYDFQSIRDVSDQCFQALQ